MVGEIEGRRGGLGEELPREGLWVLEGCLLWRGIECGSISGGAVDKLWEAGGKEWVSVCGVVMTSIIISAKIRHTCFVSLPSKGRLKRRKRGWGTH